MAGPFDENIKKIDDLKTKFVKADRRFKYSFVAAGLIAVFGLVVAFPGCNKKKAQINEQTSCVLTDISVWNSQNTFSPFPKS